MRRILLSLCLLVLACVATRAQIPYSYAPSSPVPEDLSGLGGNKNEFVQGLVRFDPATDPALARMKGMQILGVRCCLRAAYAQARQKRSAILASLGKPENIVRTFYTDFAEGWNDVLFDEPLTIGDEPIYLGLQVYETIGTPYPLMAYSRATVPQSCLVNLAKKSWEEFTDRGTLLIAALVDEAAAPLIERTAYAQNTTHPQTVAPDADFEGELYIHNFSSVPIQALDVAMLGEGAQQPTVRRISLDAPVGPYESTVITTSLHSGTTEGTAVGWHATVEGVNGETAQAGRPGVSSLYVTFDNFIRMPLVEEFTSQYCINCPQMAYFLEKAFEAYEGPYVYLSHHSGFADDVFTCGPDREIVYVFGGYENEYNPAIMYNRAMMEGESKIVQGIRDMSPAPYAEALAIAAAMPAMAEVEVVSATENGVHVKGRVARDLRESELYLSCYLVEDGISPQVYPQKGLTGDPDAPADLLDVFRHNGVILHHYTANAAGDRLEIAHDGTFDITFPAAEGVKGFGGTGRRIVAIVHPIVKDNLRANTVLNATQAYLTTGIGDVNDNGNDNVNVNGNGNGNVYDLSGRKVRVREGGVAASGRVPFKKGIYIVGRKKVVVR